MGVSAWVKSRIAICAKSAVGLNGQRDRRGQQPGPKREKQADIGGNTVRPVLL